MLLLSKKKKMLLTATQTVNKNSHLITKVFNDMFSSLGLRECLCSAGVQTNDAFTARSAVFQITLSGVSGSANLIIVHVL